MTGEWAASQCDDTLYQQAPLCDAIMSFGRSTLFRRNVDANMIPYSFVGFCQRGDSSSSSQTFKPKSLVRSLELQLPTKPQILKLLKFKFARQQAVYVPQSQAVAAKLAGC